ncbi:MAG: GatB/YqeY domain-containing protein [Bacteroidales bacterium]|nr:GatB/YqeY domain-containing protein [Bacteroidales bacterium]
MKLEEKIMASLKEAMKAKDKEKLEALRAVKAAIIITKTEKGGSEEISEAQEMAILQKLVKQRKESAELYKANNRPELADKENFEASVISEFLPKQLSETEIEAELKTIIAQTGASEPKDMGKVMGIASKNLAGKADGKLIADIVKRLLSIS